MLPPLVLTSELEQVELTELLDRMADPAATGLLLLPADWDAVLVCGFELGLGLTAGCGLAKPEAEAAAAAAAAKARALLLRAAGVATVRVAPPPPPPGLST